MTKKKKKPENKKDRLWAEAKRKCRLNDNDIRIARELGLNSRSLIKNIPSRTESWKLPVKAWIHEMAEQRQLERTLQKRDAKTNDDSPDPEQTGSSKV